jgi:hypothetical protein
MTKQEKATLDAQETILLHPSRDTLIDLISVEDWDDETEVHSWMINCGKHKGLTND